MPTGPNALVIEGEVGIGKTTVWLEALALAEARSYRVLRARPAEVEATLSYTVIADLVGTAFDETRAALPAPQERALAAALLRAELDEPVEMRTTATALVGVLTALAAEQPVLLAIDDVQWLDTASERALAFAARRLPPQVGLILTLRTGGGGAPPLALAGALAEDRLERVVLGPLSLAAVHSLLTTRLGMSPPRPTLARLATASGGNPFFALEIARAMGRDAGDRPFEDALPVPPSLHDFVAARVSALSRAAREAVLIVASLSRPTVATVAEAVAPQFDALPALVEAEEAGVLVSDLELLRFTHPLIASVVYGSSSPDRRRKVHRRLAELVTNPEERACHLAQSATEVDEATAAELEHGARDAALRGAQDAAAELFASACRLTPADQPNGLSRRMLGEASALLAVGEAARARPLAERALASTRASSLKTEALSLLASIDWAQGAMNSACDQLEQALTVAASDHELRGRLYARLARFGCVIDPKRASGHAAAAIRLLSEERTPELLASALIDRFFAEAMLGRGARRELFERGLALEAAAGAAAEKHPIPIVWFHFTDEFDAARARHAELDRWYRERGEEAWRADILGHLGMAELRAGRWALAEQYIEESCAMLVQSEARGPAAMRFVWRSLVDAHRGNVERARATLLPLIEQFERTKQPWWTAMSFSALGFVEFVAGDHRAADRALMEMGERVESIGVKEAPLDRSEPFHIESLLALGELERARAVLLRLEERGRVLPRLWITVALPRARALVLAAEGDLACALDALEELDLSAASLLPFELGWTLLVKGRLFRRAKQKRVAADALGQALEIFQRLGAPAWVDRARSELARVGLRRRSPHELTPTELRVAELAAGGLRNREVAEAAFMSAKTVEAHLSRVYRKLGIHSRAELGARMAVERRVAGTET